MSPEPGSPADWLRFARSDLAVARSRAEGDVLLETLCYHAQQATEKSLKAILVAEGVHFPRTHNLKTLLTLLPATLTVPTNVAALAALTDYAASSRYPGHYEDITDREYHDAIQLADTVVKWAEGVLDRPGTRGD